MTSIIDDSGKTSGMLIAAHSTAAPFSFRRVDNLLTDNDIADSSGNDNSLVIAPFIDPASLASTNILPNWQDAIFYLDFASTALIDETGHGHNGYLYTVRPENFKESFLGEPYNLSLWLRPSPFTPSFSYGGDFVVNTYYYDNRLEIGQTSSVFDIPVWTMVQAFELLHDFSLDFGIMLVGQRWVWVHRTPEGGGNVFRLLWHHGPTEEDNFFELIMFDQACYAGLPAEALDYRTILRSGVYHLLPNTPYMTELTFDQENHEVHLFVNGVEVLLTEDVSTTTPLSMLTLNQNPAAIFEFGQTSMSFTLDGPPELIPLFYSSPDMTLGILAYFPSAHSEAQALADYTALFG